VATPCVVALAPLDLDDIGAEIGEQARAIGTREHAGEVEHGEAGQRSVGGDHGRLVYTRCRRRPFLAPATFSSARASSSVTADADHSRRRPRASRRGDLRGTRRSRRRRERSEEHTSELQSPYDLVCRLLLEKKK